MRLPWQRSPHAAWSGGTEPEPTESGAGRVRRALAEQLEYAPSVGQVFTDRSTDPSGRVLDLGEQLIAFSLSPLGRGLTATLALTLAWLIL